jgi:hypothetical protein
VINQERQDGRAVFILGTAPGPDQIVVRSRRDALAQAKALARRERVRVWLTENGHEFSLLHDFVSARTRGTR